MNDLCPVTKEDCPFYDQSGSGREWCNGNGDPSEYEICPIPNKRKEEMKKLIYIYREDKTIE